MSYPAGAPLPSSRIILIILDGNMSDGIVPEYLENKSLSKSFVKIISLFLEKFSTVENLSTFKIQEMYSTPAGVKFTIFQYGNLLMINAHTHNIEKIVYGVSYSCNLTYNCYNTSAAITGNNGSSGHFTLDNNILAVNSTDTMMEIRNTFMGQLTTFLK